MKNSRHEAQQEKNRLGNLDENPLDWTEIELQMFLFRRLKRL